APALTRAPDGAAGRESAEGEEEPAQRIAGELLADEISGQRRQHRARLAAHLAVSRPPRRPERAKDEGHVAEETDEAELPDDLEEEVVRHVAAVAGIDGRVLAPRLEEGRLAHADERMI